MSEDEFLSSISEVSKVKQAGRNAADIGGGVDVDL
jgi:hypothetical protein